MDSMWLAGGIAGVAIVALFRLRRMMRWVPGEATFLGLAKPVLWGVSYSGQAMPISFHLQDGTEVRASLRNYSRGGLPRVGDRLKIRYDPSDPEHVEWAMALPLLAILSTVLLTALLVVLRRSLHDAGIIA